MMLKISPIVGFILFEIFLVNGSPAFKQDVPVQYTASSKPDLRKHPSVTGQKNTRGQISNSYQKDFSAHFTATDSCPKGCTCDYAPLRAAPFVLTWMTTWGEDDIPQLHPNDVMDAGDILSSNVAADADMDVEVTGQHVTCAIQPMTSVPDLLAEIPSNTMVLTLLQAPGCNYTVLEGGQFVPLHHLKALHIQGYAYKNRVQVSGFKPNEGNETDAEREERIKAEQMKHVNLVLTEDALKPLQNLQLLDLQFVRVLAERDAGRLKRFSNIHPVSHISLLDLPISEFVRLVERLNDQSDFESSLVRDPEYIKIEKLYRDSLQEQVYDKNKLFYDSNDDYDDTYSEEYDQSSEEVNYDMSNYIAEDIDNIDVVSYDVYKKKTEPHLSPFKSLRKLRYIRVAHARLDRIGPELLEGLEKIHTLTLEHNQIKVIPDDMFRLTPGLRHLSIAHNNILELNENSLTGLVNLLTLDLDNNKLSVIGTFVFPPLPSLTTIRLIENPITRILHDAFVNVNATENLYVGTSSQPVEVYTNAFRGLNNLKTLQIKNIVLPILSKDFIPTAPLLKELTLHGNVSSIDFDTFSETPNLNYLDLSNSKIELISMDAFFNLDKLTHLNLSHNEISNLDPGTFDHLSNLSELYLHNNKLTTLPPGIFLPTPAQLIHVHNNPWDCSCDLVQLTPTTTNKIKRQGYVECKWDDKLSAVCKKTSDKIVYDSRVAPLCVTPSRLQGQDVFHAAIRYLNCSKETKDIKGTQKPLSINITPTVKLLAKNLIKPKANLYLPLIAYSPPTNKPVDLLEIAKQDGLVEITDDKNLDKKRSKINVINRKSKYLQNDGQVVLSKKEQMKKHEEKRRQKKMKYKKQMREKELRKKKAEYARIKALTKRRQEEARIKKKIEKTRKLYKN